MEEYFDAVGLVKSEHHSRTFRELDEALEWVENRLLEEARVERAAEQPIELRDMDVFSRRKDETIAALMQCMDERSFKAGERIFRKGDEGSELFLVRRGAVRILLPLSGEQEHHLATFGRGDFFGEISFIDREKRSADAVALTDADLYVLTRERFDQLAAEHHKLAMNLFEGLARALAVRLRYTNAELRLLEEN